MDPMPAISLAGTIVQFVDFSIKLVSKGHSIYHSAAGTLPENLELEAITTNLSVISSRLKTYNKLGCRTEDQQRLENMSTECGNIADELLVRLEQLKLVRDGKRTVWKRFRQALISVWNAKEIDNLSTRLRAFREELEFEILSSIK
jgi:hypothetical protein